MPFGVARYLYGSVAGRLYAIAIERRDLPHISLRLPVWRDAVVLLYRRSAGVIGRQRHPHIATEVIQHLPQVPHPSLDVLSGVEGMRQAKRACRCRHELHEPHGALARNRAGIEVRFHLDHRPHQLSINAVPRRRCLNRRIYLLGSNES